MRQRIRMDTRLLERMEEGRRKPPSEMLARAERYNKAAAELGMTFEKAIAEGKLLQITAAINTPQAATAK